ncbi:helicase HerA domain-containing protein [Aquifex aeolicus]|uniref:Uncharacterized protein aq_aa31 n=1 Tax=Aquifex aeolicus (strain VF5) TaxID=224324 RepID=YZ31_AQUAE|nr:DUF87 domain-containing protein [Aquifex aeolicus]O66421.1 RecName: Full=Uncharacterized protein aq_aa31 [Aquifex aeolicus VF5]AAC07973.1 putative protein [Aquifex aeolicus VF5]
MSTGNIEAGVYYESDGSDEHIKKLREYFEKIKEEYSESFGDDLLGFTVNPVKPQSFEFILVGNDDIGLHSYVEVKLQEGIVLGKITSIFAYDMGFFANPFTSQESSVFAPVEDFKTIFSKGKDDEWKKAAIYAYLNNNGNKLKIATADVIGILKDGKLDILRNPFHVGEPVYKISEKTLGKILKKNFSGRDMEVPVKVGVIENSDIDVFVDANEVISKHMLVLGTTGSGKSYFTKRFISSLLESDKEVEVYVLDPHGEYFNDLKSYIDEN